MKRRNFQGNWKFIEERKIKREKVLITLVFSSLWVIPKYNLWDKLKLLEK